MKTRLMFVAVAVIAATMMAGPTSAGHDVDSSKYGDVMARQTEAFEAVAKNAAEGSSAPEGFAPCVNGMAAGTYPCDGIDMMSHLSRSDLGLSFVNDMWGWTDPQTRRDYALVGGTEGTVIVDITDPKRPDIVGMLPAHALDPFRPFWRDIKVYADHMYVVSEQLGHGLQVFDLTEVRGVTGPPVTFTETAHYAGFSTAHNLNINEDSGFLYAVGARNLDRSLSCGGGLHMVDIGDPTSPTFAGCFGDNGYVHDTQCVIYRGPDAEHVGKEICFNSNAAGAFGSSDHWVDIVDVTDKSNPVSLDRENYPLSGYSHQGWLTPDQRFFLHGDEGDELTHDINTTTRVWDVRDLDNLQLIGVFHNDTTSIDHNLYTEGRVATASNYTSGLRVYDTRNVSAGELSEVAFFDVYPENDNASFEGGTWSNYPYFRQKRIVGVSSIDRGLFVLRPRIGAVGN
jgi:choice-of-anchor B domain-containing protein